MKKCETVQFLTELSHFLQISAYPGEPFRISIKAYDELGRPTAAVLRLSERDVSRLHLY